MRAYDCALGQLGHAKASTTLNVYAHWVEESDDAAADTMSQLIDGPRGDVRSST